MSPRLHDHHSCSDCSHDHDHSGAQKPLTVVRFPQPNGAAPERPNGVSERAGSQRRTVFDVADLCCQSEVKLIDEALQGVAGVDEYAVNIAAGTLALYHDGAKERADEVVEKLRRVGLHAAPRTAVGRADVAAPSPYSAHFWVVVIGTVLAALGAVLRYGAQEPVASAAVFGAAILIGGFFVFRQAFAALRQRQFNIPVLVTIAVVGAGFIGEWFEAATVIILFAFAEWLEARSMARARREIGALMELSPQTALRVRADGETEEVPLEEVAVGDLLRLRPGARVPVDATIVEGRTEIDESTITGEPVPVVKKKDDAVFSGTVNGAGAVTIRATQLASKSTLARIIDAIEDARANQSPTEQFIDRFARVYTPAVVAIAVLVALVPPLFFGALWNEWLYRALVFLVIACPCALVISTPIANVAGLARAAREGVLIKGGKFLELLGQIEAIAFDKTGTLTAGRPTVEEIRPVGAHTEAQVLLLAARAESESEHHVGRAVVHAARHRFSPERFMGRASDINAEVGQGIEATLRLDDPELQGLASEEAARVRVGNAGWLKECGVAVSQALAERWEQMEHNGQTVVGVTLSDELVGLIALSDVVRPQAARAVAELETLGVSDAYLITGDNWTTARRVADGLGLKPDAVFARLLPHEKVAKIRELGERHQKIAMVGDGVNDAPALAGATVGIAMGAAGTDVALESADVALMGDDLERLPHAVDIGRQTTRVIRQNIAVALGLKAIFLVLAIMGIATLWMAIVADMGASLIVIFNAIRLLRTRTEEPRAESDALVQPATT